MWPGSARGADLGARCQRGDVTCPADLAAIPIGWVPSAAARSGVRGRRRPAGPGALSAARRGTRARFDWRRAGARCAAGSSRSRQPSSSWSCSRVRTPRIGMTHRPRWRTQATATCAEVAPSSSATRSTSRAVWRFRSVRRCLDRQRLIRDLLCRTPSPPMSYSGRTQLLSMTVPSRRASNITPMGGDPFATRPTVVPVGCDPTRDRRLGPWPGDPRLGVDVPR